MGGVGESLIIGQEDTAYLGDTQSDMADCGMLRFDLLGDTIFQELHEDHKRAACPRGHWLIRFWDPLPLPVQDLFHSSSSELGKATELFRLIVVRHITMFIAGTKQIAKSICICK